MTTPTCRQCNEPIYEEHINGLCDRHSLTATILECIPKRFRSATMAQLPESLAAKLGERRSLYLHGPVGCGKTHTVAAIALEWLQPIRWANVPALLETIRRSFNDNQATVDDVATTRRIVVLDDLGAEKPSEWVRERLYQIINHRYENDLTTVITSNLSVDDLAKRVGARNSSRIYELCEAIELRGMDRRRGTAT